MRRGRMEPEERLDLHGMTSERAHSALHGFILSAAARDLRLVLVITGKGKADESVHQPRRHGILRHSLPHWLGAPPLIGHILQVDPGAPAAWGGRGVLYLSAAATVTWSLPGPGGGALLHDSGGKGAAVFSGTSSTSVRSGPLGSRGRGPEDAMTQGIRRGVRRTVAPRRGVSFHRPGADAVGSAGGLPEAGRRTDPNAGVILAPPWDGGRDGFEAFATLEVLYWLHEWRRDVCAAGTGVAGTLAAWVGRFGRAVRWSARARRRRGVRQSRRAPNPGVAAPRTRYASALGGRTHPDFVDGRNPEPHRSARPAAGRWAGPFAIRDAWARISPPGAGGPDLACGEGRVA